MKYRVAENTLIAGLLQLKGIPVSLLQKITDEREESGQFLDYHDFLDEGTAFVITGLVKKDLGSFHIQVGALLPLFRRNGVLRPAST